MNKQTLIKILHALKYVVGPALLVLVIWWKWHETGADGQEVGISRIFDPNFHVHWGPLTVALIICLICMILTFVRWYVLVIAQDLPFTVSSAIRLGFIGSFFSMFLPGAVTGDLVKMVQLVREQNRRTVAVATIVIDRIMGLVGLIWLVAVLGAVFWGTGLMQNMVPSGAGRQGLEIIVLTSWALLAGSLVFWFLLGVLPLSTTTHWIARIESIPKLGHAFAELCRATLMYRARARAVAAALAIAFIGHTGFVLTFYFCSLSVNPADDVPKLSTHFLIAPVGATVQAGVPTPGGMGGGEVAYGLLYALVDKKSAEAAEKQVEAEAAEKQAENAGNQTEAEAARKQADEARKLTEDAQKQASAEGVLARLINRILEMLLAIVGFAIYYWRMKPALQAAAAEQKAEVAAEAAGLSSDQLQPIPSP